MLRRRHPRYRRLRGPRRRSVVVPNVVAIGVVSIATFLQFERLLAWAPSPGHLRRDVNV